ncbi:hypothetical protein Amet_1804 [Alkaliphilus metalliredigens QYMF]|uniref:Uncharacterized protein n=1 Tax=Alkaliphilus metalliredigens (strain QYMF) TaxID=293826 RepID=A6TP56_ALKMQ|nr:hypothetical protein Amet_1804 [Alkaliphilus metalliredigens QYMF]
MKTFPLYSEGQIEAKASKLDFKLKGGNLVNCIKKMMQRCVQFI